VLAPAPPLHLRQPLLLPVAMPRRRRPQLPARPAAALVSAPARGGAAGRLGLRF
jgi:hypothetical protein